MKMGNKAPRPFRRQKKSELTRPYHRYTSEQQYQVLKDKFDNTKISIAKLARKYKGHPRMAQKWWETFIRPPTTRHPVIPMEQLTSVFSVNGASVNEDEDRFGMPVNENKLALKLEAMRISFTGRNAYLQRGVQQVTQAMSHLDISNN
jgi:hypothetical protein